MRLTQQLDGKCGATRLGQGLSNIACEFPEMLNDPRTAPALERNSDCTLPLTSALGEMSSCPVALSMPACTFTERN